MDTAAFTPLPMPSLYCPGPAKSAPDSQRLDANTIAWMDRLGVYRDREQRDYLARLRQQVCDDASPELARYLTGLGDWHRGYLEWALYVTNRYTEPGNPGDPVQTERLTIPPFAEQPVDDNPQPLPIPTITWWWEQLQ
jgi:hypothetical protein